MITLSKRIVDVETLADFFGCTERNIQLWCSEHGAPKLDRGQYDFDSFVKWRIGYLEGQIEIEKQGGQEKYKLEAEGQRLTNIERAQRILIKQKKLIDFDLVRQAYVNDASAFRLGLDKLVFRIDEIFKTINDNQKMRKKIHAEIIDIRNRLGNELKINEDDLTDEEENNIEEQLNAEETE